MTQQPTVETLERFGGEFQAKVLSLLIRDHTFVQQTFDIIDPEYFESDSRKWIAKVIIEYFKHYKKLPTQTVFMTEIKKISSDVHQVAVKEELRTVALHVNADDLEYVKDKFLQFCKNQTLKAAIFESVDFLEAHNYDGIKATIDRAMRAGSERNYGHDWKKDFDKRLLEDSRPTLATPWDCVNAIMDGGLSNGELGVVAAPAGAGKSWMLAAIGAASARAGKKVLQFTLELNDIYTGTRYDTVFSGIEPSKHKENYDRLKKAVMAVPGEILIKYFPSKTVNSHKLLAHIHQLDGIGFSPDIIIVDYADLLRSNERADARYLELGAIYEELRSMAGELQVPCWTASQTQRSSIQDEVIQADKIAESYSKIMTADFVLSLSRTLNDKQTNTGRVHIIKNRFGPDGMTFPAKIDVINGVLDVYDETSVQGIQARQAMANSDNAVKRMLHSRLKDHQDSGNDLG
jgi:replicative DNA helicase